MNRKNLHNNLIFALITYIFIIVCSVVFYNYMLFRQVEPVTIMERLKRLEIELCRKDCERRPLDGRCKEGALPAIFAVMIDNHSQARPQAGISKAALVYETIAEAPITRFMAMFYLDPSLEKIGPVRSARPFFIDWVKEYGVAYAHVGGSPDALDILAKSYSFDLNEMSNGQYFYRDELLDAPHNTFTDAELIAKALENKKWQIKMPATAWQYSEEPLITSSATADSIRIDFGGENSQVEWRFDPEKKDYLRYQSGKIHRDSNGGEVRAKNIIVMRTESIAIDDYGRRETTTVGSGPAKIFYRGSAISCTWKRDSLDQPTKFFADNGEEIVLVPGITWIEVVPTYLPDIKIGSGKSETGNNREKK